MLDIFSYIRFLEDLITKSESGSIPSRSLSEREGIGLRVMKLNEKVL